MTRTRESANTNKGRTRTHRYRDLTDEEIAELLGPEYTSPEYQQKHGGGGPNEPPPEDRRRRGVHGGRLVGGGRLRGVPTMTHETDTSAGWRAEYAYQGVGGGVEARRTAGSSPGRPSSGAGEWAVAGTPRPPAHDATAGVERPPRRGGEQ